MTVAMGPHSFIGSEGRITAKVTIGAYTGIAPGVQMVGRIQHPCIAHPELVSSGTGRLFPGYPKPINHDGIQIGSDVWIGQNAVLVGGITIGHGAIIGMYAVVTKDVQPYDIVGGNPATVIRSRYDQTTITRLLALRWWDWPHELVVERFTQAPTVKALLATWG
jgi:virginiamycin A acetyltransferase